MSDRHAIHWAGAVIGIALTIAASPAGHQAQVPEDPVDGLYLVVLDDAQVQRSARPMAAHASQLALEHGGRVVSVYSHALNGFAVELAPERAASLARDPLVRWVEPNRRAVAVATQTNATWGLDRIDQRDLPLSTTYTYDTLASNVSVYIIDGGIRASHVDFGGRVRSGMTVINDGRGTSDCDGHGTHVAGTAGGATWGVAKGVTLYAVRVLDCQGFGTTNGVVGAIDWVTANRVLPAVANLSLALTDAAGTPVGDPTIDLALRNSMASGITYVVAAGNSTADACRGSPGRVTEALTVGASEINDARRTSSNFGSCVDLFAPGGGITSAWATSDTATQTISGTSMASPHVAGAAALYLATNPGAAPSTVGQAIVNAATVGRLTNLGAGSPNRLLYVATPPPPCSYTVSPTSVTIAGAGGAASASVTTTAGCAWTAISAASWITVTSGSTGTGSGLVTYAVATNSGPARTGTLTVAGRTVTVSQNADADTDADGLPDSWETRFGLNPALGTGADGPAGDPDGDQRTNLQEYMAVTHPRGFVTRYLAEGVVNTFFQTEIALLNPGATPAITLLRVQPEGLTERAYVITVPPLTRRTVTSASLAQLTTAPFSTVVESDAPVVVDRTMSWDASGYGTHAETSLPAPSTTWYLAEGSTSGEFSLFYLLQNPNPATVTATVTFLRPSGLPPLPFTYALPPNSRTTIPVDNLAGLTSTDVSGTVAASQPIIVERAMYLNRPGQAFAAGHGSAGVTAPALQWFLAEGATGSFFELFILIANPGTAAAQITADYLLSTGGVVSKSYTVPAQGRFTIWVDNEQVPAGSGLRPLANVAVSTRVRSTNGVPIIVERAMWWPQPVWHEAHNSPGATVTGTRWALAAGEVGGARSQETYVLIANTSSFAAQARVTVHFEDGTSAQRSYALLANSRFNVPVSTDFPAAAGRRFGTMVESLGTTPAQIVVERAMYASPGGVVWSAGTAALATRLAP